VTVINIIVTGSNNSLVELIPNNLIIGCANGCWKSNSGAVKTPINGSTALILAISERDDRIINMIRK
jgi:hypothetical protein